MQQGAWITFLTHITFQWQAPKKTPQWMFQPQTCYLHLQAHHQQPTYVHVSTLGFKVTKHVIRRGIITFKSYLKTSLIASPRPINFFTICNDLNQGSNIMANMLQTWSKIFNINIWKKGFKTFTTSSRIFLWKRKNVKWNWSKTFVPFETCTNLDISTCSLIIIVIIVVKTSNNC